MTKALRWLGLLLVGAVVLNVAARLVAGAIPFLVVLATFVLIFGLLLGFFRTSK